MRLFKLKRDYDFWPQVPLKDGINRWSDARLVTGGSIVTKFTVAKSAPNPSSHQTTVEVLEGEFKGYQRYADKSELVGLSALELLAREADDV